MLNILVKILLITSIAYARKLEKDQDYEIKVLEGEQGQTVELNCDLNIEDHGRGVLVWKQGKRILFAGSMRVRQDPRMILGEFGVLRVVDLSPVDAGEYSCQVELSTGELLVSRKSVIVLQPPSAKIVPGGGALTVKTGTSMVLTCSGSGVPVPEITWTKNGELQATGRGQADLPLREVTWQAGGLYQCHANNGVGGEHIKNFTVNVLHAPVVEVLPAEVEMNTQQTCRVQIQCLVYSSPSSRIQWFHDGRLLTAGEGITMWTLEYLHVLQLDDCEDRAGEYTCLAENSMGTNQGVTRLEPHMLKVEEVVVRVDRQISLSSATSLYSSLALIILPILWSLR